MRSTPLPRSLGARLRRALLLPATVAALVALAARESVAQSAEQREATLADTMPRLRSCELRMVTAIDIKPQYPNLGGFFKRAPWVAGVVQDLHAVTREEVIRRFLALQVGDRCSELRRAESERILRQQPYLADARVVVRDDGNGGARLEVVTFDELSYVFGIAATTAGGAGLTAFKFGNRNVGGDAVDAQGEWRNGGFYRDLYAIRLVDYQLMGRPYQLALEGARRPQGHNWSGEFTHPFYSDLQRVAWRLSMGELDQYQQLLRQGDLLAPSVNVVRRFWSGGGILRIGLPGRLSLFGASLSLESEHPAPEPVFVTDTGIVPVNDSAAASLAGQWTPHRVARVNALWGVRNVRFLRVNGFDALRGSQDVRIGFQFGALFGRSLPFIGSDDDDIFVQSDVYIANGTRRNFVALQARGEGREDGNTRRWDGILGSGRLAWYTRPGSRVTIESSAEWSGGWRTRIPFQVSLADLDGGVRGYIDSRLAGAQRAVVRVEDRIFLGTVKGLADAGLATFVDAGRLWAGDAPFGVDATPRIGAGLGLIVAVPPRSKRIFRIDVARAFTADPDAKFEIRLTSGDFTRSFWRDPSDIRRASERTVPESVFNWP